MPQLGETVTEGTIITWSKHVGDEVEVDDALFEVSTEKVDTEVPSAVAGYLRTVLADEGDTVVVGAPVAIITATLEDAVVLPDAAGEGASAVGPPTRRGSDGPDGDDPAGSAPVGAGRGSGGGLRSTARTGSTNGAGGWADGRPDGAPGNGISDRYSEPAGPQHERQGGRGVLSPAVRRLLHEHHLAPDDVVGSGRDARITRADVLAVAAQWTRRVPETSVPGDASPPGGPASVAADSLAPAAVAGRPTSAGTTASPVARGATPSPVSEIGDGDEVVELSRARIATGQRLVDSLATAAHALVVVEVDYHRVDAVRRAAGLTYLPFVARAVIDAVAAFPRVNASLDGPRLVAHRRVRLGVAVDLDQEALVVPVVTDADGLRLPALARRIGDLADRARRRRLTGDALLGATLTVTNVGAHGTLVTVPIIDQPQVAIVSTDGVRMAPVAVRTDPGGDGDEPTWGVTVHPVGNLSCSFDHRAFDGAYAAAFLARVRTVLESRDWHQEVHP